MILPADVVDSAVHFTYSLQTGSYPETGFAEILTSAALLPPALPPSRLVARINFQLSPSIGTYRTVPGTTLRSNTSPERCMLTG